MESTEEYGVLGKEKSKLEVSLRLVRFKGDGNPETCVVKNTDYLREDEEKVPVMGEKEKGSQIVNMKPFGRGSEGSV